MGAGGSRWKSGPRRDRGSARSLQTSSSITLSISGFTGGDGGRQQDRSSSVDADDLVIGCQHEAEARQLLAELKDRLAQFGLSLHEGKTRLIEFGRFATERRAAAGQRRPATFDFLGFTHYCGRTRSGRFVVKRKTQAKRMVRKLKAVRQDMLHRMHAPVREQHRWLGQILRGHYRYYGVIFIDRALRVFKDCV